MTVTTKIVRTFVFAFLGPFLAGLADILLDLSKSGDWTVARVAVVSLAIGAASAATRALVAFLPVFADDNVGIEKK